MARLADYFAVIGLDNELKPLQRDLAGKFLSFFLLISTAKNLREASDILYGVLSFRCIKNQRSRNRDYGTSRSLRP